MKNLLEVVLLTRSHGPIEQVLLFVTYKFVYDRAINHNKYGSMWLMILYSKGRVVTLTRVI